MKSALEQIELSDMAIEDNIADHGTYYLKGLALVKLSQLTNDKTKLQAALSCYNKAIELQPIEVLYLAERSKLYIAIGNTELALSDIDSLRKLLQTSTGSTTNLANTYARNTIHNILEAVQKSS